MIQSSKHGSSHRIQIVFSLQGIWSLWSGTPETSLNWKLKKIKYESHPAIKNNRPHYIKIKPFVRLLYLNIPLVLLCECTLSDDPGLSKSACLSQSSRGLCGLQILALTKAYFSGSSHQGAHAPQSKTSASCDFMVVSTALCSLVRVSSIIPQSCLDCLVFTYCLEVHVTTEPFKFWIMDVEIMPKTGFLPLWSH